MIRSVFGAYAGQALRVASCESGYAPNAYNRSSGASGVFQFLASTWRTTSYAGYSRFNAWANIHAAHQVFVRDGYSWREWSCKPW
jgi:SLT domain-containing protein